MALPRQEGGGTARFSSAIRQEPIVVLELALLTSAELRLDSNIGELGNGWEQTPTWIVCETLGSYFPVWGGGTC